MAFFKNLFSGQKSKEGFLEQFLEDLFQTCGFALSCDQAEKIERENEVILNINVYGQDEELLTKQGGRLLQALKVYTQAAFRSQSAENDIRVKVNIDSGDFLKQQEDEVLQLALDLKEKVLKRKKPLVVKKPLNSFQRRKIHQILTEDGLVKTESIGEGLYKMIKIFPSGRASDDFNRA